MLAGLSFSNASPKTWATAWRMAGPLPPPSAIKIGGLSAADAAVDHLVNTCGLHPDHDAVLHYPTGKTVFVYRPVKSRKAESSGSGEGQIPCLKFKRGE